MSAASTVARRTGAMRGDVAIVGLAALVRLPTLGQQSFWLDEAATLNVLHHSFGSVFSAIVDHESTPPLYYLLAWVWSHALGYSEVAVRLLPALFGIATVAVVRSAAARVAGTRAGVIAGVLAAVNPLLVWYSQEARAYSLLALFGALSFHFAIRAVDGSADDRRELWRWGIVAALALCTHYFAVLFVAPEAAWLLWRRGARARLPIAAVIACGLALAPLALAQRKTGRTDWISGSPLHTRLVLIPKQFVTGLSAPAQTLLAAVALAGALAIAATAVVRRVRLPEPALAAAAITVGAPLVMAALALIGIDVVLTRNAIGVLPIAFVGLGVALDALLVAKSDAPVALAGAAVALSGVVALVAVVTDAAYERTDWRAAAEIVNASRSRHLVVLDPSSAQLPLSLYVRLSAPRRGRPVLTREIDVVHFLLDTQGARRAGATVRIPAGFVPASVRRWPGIDVQRYRAPGVLPVEVSAIGARTLAVDSR